MAAWSADDRELMRADKVLRRVMEEQGPIDPEIDRRGSRPDPWEALARAIVGQQLSTKAAASIWDKLLAIIRRPDAHPGGSSCREGGRTLRKAGLSNAKVEYLRDLAAADQGRPARPRPPQGPLRRGRIAELIEVKGIGRWTAEMFLIFHLGREDVVSAGDLGIRRAVQIAYGMDELPGPEELERIAEPGGRTARSPASTCGGPWTTRRPSG